MTVPVLFEDNHLLVINKPVNVPCQEDASGDLDLLNLLKADLKERHAKPGNVFLGLVHRLDRPTSGVMVFAKTSKAASRLSDQVRRHVFDKRYLVVVEGRLPSSGGRLEDYLHKDSATNQVWVCSADDPGARDAALEYEILETGKQGTLVAVQLFTGRSHQIRVQFASRDCPVWGDHRYGSGSGGQQLALHASRLSLEHPTTKDALSFDAPFPERVPFDRFG